MTAPLAMPTPGSSRKIWAAPARFWEQPGAPPHLQSWRELRHPAQAESTEGACRRSRSPMHTHLFNFIYFISFLAPPRGSKTCTFASPGGVHLPAPSRHAANPNLPDTASLFGFSSHRDSTEVLDKAAKRFAKWKLLLETIPPWQIRPD